MPRIKPLLPVLALAAASLLATPAQALLTTHATLGSFTGATAANTVIDFTGTSFAGLTDLGNVWYNDDVPGFTLGGATFTVVGNIGGSFYQAIVAPAYSPPYYERGTGNILHAEYERALMISFAAPVEAFALDLSSIAGRSGITTLSFSNGDSASAALGDPWAFHGFVSDTPFTSVTLSGVSGDYLMVDNIRFVSIEEVASPEPASLALLALGLAALTSRRRKA